MSNSACSKQHRQKPNIIFSTIKADKHATWITVTVELHKSFVVDLYTILIRATSYCLFVIISVIFDISKIKVIFLCLYLQVLQWANRNADFVLPMYIFDPRHFGGTYHFGFPKTGPHRTKFLLESIQDLRKNLKIRGRLG